MRGHNAEGDREALEGARLIGGIAAAGARGAATTSTRARVCSKARSTRAPRWPPPASVSATRWRRRSAAATASRTARRTRSCLPPALRFNAPVAVAEIARFGEALGAQDPVARTEELAHAAGVTRLRDLGVPEGELDEVAVATAQRAGAKANPRPASPAEIAELLRSIW